MAVIGLAVLGAVSASYGLVDEKIDFNLFLAGGGYSELRPVYEVLERHWSEVSRDERFLAYYIESGLTGEEPKNKYTTLYFESMIRYISRPFLIPCSKCL